MVSKSYSKGISWIDDCRIPFVDDKDKNERVNQEKSRKSSHIRDGFMNTIVIPQIEQTGRFPANLLVSDDMLNDGIKPNKGHRSKSKVSGYGEFGGGKSEYYGIGEYMNVDSTSRYYDIDHWFNNLIDV